MKYTAGLLSFAVIRTRNNNNNNNNNNRIMTQKRKVEDTLLLSSSMPIQQQQQQQQVNSGSTSLCMADNPFWGSSLPEEHNLAFLLKEMKDGCLKSTCNGDDDDDNDNEQSTNENTHKSGDNKNDDTSGSYSISSTRPPGIIYEDDNYLVLNKPADVRMDGPYLATVHKLLTYWYPSPSLLHLVQQANTNNNNNKDGLMEEVLKLHTFSDLKDNELRPAHQLDYATSGVLLVCRSKKTAAAANAAFERRETGKEYLALVYGHLSNDDIPILDKHHLSQWDDGSKEKSYRKTRDRKYKTTFSGFMPTHTIFQKWKQYYQNQTKQQQQKQQQQYQQYQQKIRQYDILHQQIFQIATDSLSNEELNQLVTLKWNNVKSNNQWVQTFQKMANHYNSNVHPSSSSSSSQTNNNSSHANDTVKNCSPTPNQQQQQHQDQQPLPHIFRIRGEDDNSFYVHASLAQIQDNFRMQVDPSALTSKHLSPEYKKYYSSFHQSVSINNNDDSTTTNSSSKNDSSSQNKLRNNSLDFKPSLTRVTILSQENIKITNNNNNNNNNKDGYRHNQTTIMKATKVKLQPRTGRRHQLRLHMVVCGCPIIGDVTYQPPDGNKKNNVILLRGEKERMCLHAHRLTIPLLNKNEKVTFEAPDPFLQS